MMSMRLTPATASVRLNTNSTVPVAATLPPTATDSTNGCEVLATLLVTPMAAPGALIQPLTALPVSWLMTCEPASGVPPPGVTPM